jgi:arsenite methyltransferase
MAPEHAPAEHGVRLVADLDLESLLVTGDPGACCAAVYEHPAVRWLLGDELHPGGVETTRRSLDLIGVGRDDRLLDVACGGGTSALLAARERGCEAVGVDSGEAALERASALAREEGLADRVRFRAADAGRLPFADQGFDALLCECSVSTFADKPAAVAEMWRVLRPSGRVAISDVVVDEERLPAALHGPLATIACVGEALDGDGYRGLLADGGFREIEAESHGAAAARLATRVEERLRGARLLGVPALEGLIESARLTGRAIDEGILGYAIFTAVRR